MHFRTEDEAGEGSKRLRRMGRMSEQKVKGNERRATKKLTYAVQGRLTCEEGGGWREETESETERKDEEGEERRERGDVEEKKDGERKGPERSRRSLDFLSLPTNLAPLRP
jgi:hypothetical protein